MASSRKRIVSSATSIDHEAVSPADSNVAILPYPIDREDLAWYVRHNLSREERLIVMLHYAEELSLAEVAAVLCLTQAEVEAKHTALVARLDRAVKNNEMGCALSTSY